MVIGLVTPVLKNFKGYTELIKSVDYPILPIVIDNWIDNRGVARAWNLGIKQSIEQEIKFTLVTNDDIVFEKDCLNTLISNFTTDVDLITAKNVRDNNKLENRIDTTCADYSCFMIRPEQFVDKFGFFDETIYPAYFEDNDMDYRIKLAGGVSATNTSARMFHAGSVTQNMDGPVVTSQMFEKNRDYYIKKWGGVPGKETFTTPFNDPSMTIKDW